ncbi:NAD-dependent epimerase/dehydratase family protein [Pararobbsia alpina]|uniref:GDP-6-deoxy-D-talose 4-dehydrogenase n=1 Tax=Pararobbsia alpina TaxID=621374 RepID=A0A6S7BK11_9BURK|nr:NAD-dependent epimerase/dehydratase family protein [Pararobbsia alpina]CAB3803197.1 GDP-6-deoxy-D-talose 4-dehydrogenase [Pararobbsia alpina]
MKILLTGVRGFTGPYVRAELERAGHTVIGTVFGAATSATEIGLDIQCLSACRAAIEQERPDVIINLAGIAATQEAHTEPYYLTNVIGAENLLRACWDVGHMPKKILMISSSVVYGMPMEGQTEIDENSPQRPVNHYGISKLAMELLARTWFDRLPILIVRPFNYIGRGQKPNFVTAKIVDHFRRKAPFVELGNLDVARDFSDVRDVAAIYRMLIETDAVSDVVNVCSGRAYPLQYVLNTLQAITGHPLDVRVNPAFVRANDPKLVRGATAKLEGLIGERRIHDFDSTLEWMAEGDLESRPSVVFAEANAAP